MSTIFMASGSVSKRIDSDTPSTANFVPPYAGKSGKPTLPAIELTFTIVPPRSVKLDKGVFSCNVIFTSAGLRNSGRCGMIEKLAGTEYNGGEEAAVITAIPKDKAEELLEVIRNGMDMQRETYYQPQIRRQQRAQVYTTTNNHINC
jgi:hypothetical protein